MFSHVFPLSSDSFFLHFSLFSSVVRVYFYYTCLEDVLDCELSGDDHPEYAQVLQMLKSLACVHLLPVFTDNCLMDEIIFYEGNSEYLDDLLKSFGVERSCLTDILTYVEQHIRKNEAGSNA